MVAESPLQIFMVSGTIVAFKHVFTVIAFVVAEHPVVLVKVKVAEPAETPVITPALLMVATLVLELFHVPPVVGLAVIVAATQTFVSEVLTVGFVQHSESCMFSF